MKKLIILILSFSTTSLILAQDKGNYFYQPFSIYTNAGKVVIAGTVKTSLYTSKEESQSCADAHTSPECLVKELFKNMKTKNVKEIQNLYDTSFKPGDFKTQSDFLKNYNSIHFRSKFKIDHDIIVRYDFVGTGKPAPYFAAVKMEGSKFNLTENLNLSDPFNEIGAHSPYNLFDKKQEAVNVKGMTTFYFVHKENKIFYADNLPDEDYAALYLSFEFYQKNSISAEGQFLKQLQLAAQSPDSMLFKKMLAPKEEALLADPYFHNYYYDEIKKIFKYFSVAPLASLKLPDGKILYIQYTDEDNNSYIGSIILKQVTGKNFLTLRINNDVVNNILQNVYIRQAIYSYMQTVSP